MYFLSIFVLKYSFKIIGMSIKCSSKKVELVTSSSIWVSTQL